MRKLGLEISGTLFDEVTVDLNGHPSLRARIGFEEVSRTLTGAEVEDLVAKIAALPVSGLPLGEIMGVDGVIYRLTVSSAPERSNTPGGAISRKDGRPPNDWRTGWFLSRG